MTKNWLSLYQGNEQVPKDFNKGDNAFTCSIDGSLVSSTDQLLSAISQGLRFPYFGNNWNALQDCFCDLAWLEADEITVHWNDCGDFLRNHPDDFVTFLEVFHAASNGWTGKEKELYLILSDRLVYAFSAVLKQP